MMNKRRDLILAPGLMLLSPWALAALSEGDAASGIRAALERGVAAAVDMLGTAQSGLPPLRLGDLFADADLMKLARNHTFLIFEKDPLLERPENAGCRSLLAMSRLSVLSQVS